MVDKHLHKIACLKFVLSSNPGEAESWKRMLTANDHFNQILTSLPIPSISLDNNYSCVMVLSCVFDFELNHTTMPGIEQVGRM